MALPFWVPLALAASAAVALSQTLVSHTFNSRVFQNVRTIRVLFPGDCSESGNQRRYPVLCRNDGQNLFDASDATFNRI